MVDKRPLRSIKAVYVISSLAIIGVLTTFIIRAATPESFVEAEAFTLSTPSLISASDKASGSSFVHFKSTEPLGFPSQIKTSGRQLIDENGVPLETLKGFNMQVSAGFVWPQSNFDEIASLGARVNRTVIFWDEFEPQQGSINQQYANNLDTHIARAEKAGLYSIIDLHLNVGRTPAWTSAQNDEMAKYQAYGQNITQFLANRYGNPDSPHYTKSVMGFGLNEPTLSDANIRNGNNSIPYLEEIQRKMIEWFRAPGNAPDWIGFVAFGYGAATPIYDDSFQNPNAVDANPKAYDSVGGNVVVDFHDYFVGITGPESSNPNANARQWNGMIFPDYQGGPMLGPDSASVNYVSTATTRSQIARYIKPYADYTRNANLPFMIGEWGWVATSQGSEAWLQDHKAEWDKAEAVIQIYWDYDITSDTNKDKWAARPGGNWQPVVLRWLSSD